MLWLGIGLLAGLCIAYLWPYEPAQASGVDRAEQFSILTVPVQLADPLEGIFLFDFLTGRLEGKVLNPSFGKFSHTYFRNVANDFDLAQTRNPQFTVIGAQASLPSVGPRSMASGVIYVAEMKTGQVVCYGFPYNQSNQIVPPVELMPIDRFQFRQ
jgi:hypothetical protein